MALYIQNELGRTAEKSDCWSLLVHGLYPAMSKEQ